MELQFPLAGLHEGVSAEKQPPTTSPFLMNVRPFDVNEERARGGQRPGTKKAYSTRVGGDRPVLLMVSISNTYITPV
jgi:hypothetical protein